MDHKIVGSYQGIDPYRFYKCLFSKAFVSKYMPRLFGFRKVKMLEIREVAKIMVLSNN
jgi:hypothetical protein